MFHILLHILSGSCFRRRCSGHSGDVKQLVQAWRDLTLEFAANGNPFAMIDESQGFSNNMADDYFPGGSVTFVDARGEIRLDRIQEHNHDLAQAYCAIGQFNATQQPVRLQEAEVFFLQAGRTLLAAGQSLLALRAFLNSFRIDNTKPYVHRELATCLAQLGDFGNAAGEYIIAAELFLDIADIGPGGTRPRPEDAAEAYELAGLAWERRGTAQRPQLGTHNGMYDSTVCFRKAKQLYGSLGESSASSRCSVLEMDSKRRWTIGRTRRGVLGVMRRVWLYGESPTLVFGTALLVWFLSAVIYFYGGFRTGSETISYAPAFSVVWRGAYDFLRALYFSAVTMATLGYGDYTPAGWLSHAIAAIEGFLGILAASMFAIAMQRRFVGR